MADHKILVVDDDPDAIRLLKSLIATLGFEVSGTTSGREAVKIYQRLKPDLVLTDLRMPDLDGIALLTAVKQFDPQAKVAILTAYGEKDTIAQAFRLGAVEFLEKPLNTTDLLNTVEDLVKQDDQVLEGDLRMMSLASIIQINCEERNQALLELVSEGKRGRIYFSEGEIVHADIGDLVGEQAVYRLLAWEAGTFRLRMGQSPPQRSIHTGWSGLLLEGMRRLDESTAGWSTVWEEEFPEETPAKDDLQERIVKALQGLPEIQGALISDPEGKVLGYQGARDADQISALISALLMRAESLSGIINGSDGESLERVVISGDEAKVLFFPHKGNYIYISLTKRASIDAVWQTIHRTLKRYRSA